MSWGFYGRSGEIGEVRSVLERRRFFFARLTGRRRIGKTTLVQQALAASGRRQFLYVQIPDSAPAGVLSAVRDAMETFEISAEAFPRPDTLGRLASTLEQLMRAGYVVALDEFQYFSRRHLHEFLSHLQAAVDRLLRDAEHVTGGLIVLGSLHAELVALLDDRDAPLYSRSTARRKRSASERASATRLASVENRPLCSVTLPDSRQSIRSTPLGKQNSLHVRRASSNRIARH